MSGELAGNEIERRELPPPAPVVKPPKVPGIALILSLFPGLGHVYNGQPAKAFVFFFSWAACTYLTIQEPIPFGLFIPFVYLYNLVDAWRSAVAINDRAAGTPGLPAEDPVESPAWGITLMLVGVVLLLHNLHWLNLEAVARYWPVLLIVAGGYFLRSAFLKRSDGNGPAL
jgi:hypothetical protein